MGRLVAAVAVAAVVVVTSAAAGPGSELLAVSASGSELLLLSPAGDVSAQLLGGPGKTVVDATWSPDGRRIAFTSPPPSGIGREVWVVDGDGTGLRAVTADSDAGRYNTIPLWISPTEIVYHRFEDRTPRTELRVVDVDTRAVRLLAPEADYNFPLRMQPHGSLLLYTLPGVLRRALVNVRTGERTTLPERIGQAAAWSQDGSQLAYGNDAGLHVIRPDGTGQRTLVANRRVDNVEWAPDDRRILFTIVELFGPLGGKFGPPYLSEVYTIAPGGSGLHRLTGIEGDSPFAGDSGAFTPSWWPDGSRLFFRARRNPAANEPVQNWVMNADGSCEMQWAPRVQTWATPKWRPTSLGTSGPADCASVIVRARIDRTELGIRDRTAITVTVRNDGTRSLGHLRLVLTTTQGTLRLHDPCDRLLCQLGTLPPGNERTMTLEATSHTPGLLRIGAAASYDGGPDAFPPDNRATIAANVLPCDLVGTWGPDRLEGTPRRDRICGRPGDDRIDAGAGNDDIDAGSGRDTVLAGRGRDTIRGGGGADVIVVRDRERDVVNCGTETDTVIADRKDITRNCERVLR